MNTQSLRRSEQLQREMFQKSRLHDPFFGLKGLEPRPTSVATEIVDTDWDEDDIISEIEDDDPNSPRVSLNSSGQQSVTTLSSYDEAQTPRSSRAREAYPFGVDPSKPVEGPRGPHLFRSSTASSNSFEYQVALSLSPITPKTARPFETDFRIPLAHDPLPPRSRSSPFQFTYEELDPSELATWTPEKVAQWMLNAGIELSTAEKFIENDINGAILITLKFEDLRELDIQSFGVRTKVWEKIHILRDSRSATPTPETPIQDEESKEARKERIRAAKAENGQADEPETVKRSKSLKRGDSRRKPPSHEDIISPLESVSIVGIEQMMPKPHHCSKGENCSKWRRQQRMIEAFKRDHPFVNVEQGGIIMVAGDPGNPETAPAINRQPSTEALRPMSDAVPSVVASSDVLGPGIAPFQYLQEAALRNLQTQDPQDSVRHFLDFQHQHLDPDSSEVPPTPPFEVLPATKPPHEGLRALPKLAIPAQKQARRQSQQARPVNPPQPAYPQPIDRSRTVSPDQQTPTAPYRFGTPFSDMDVPLTNVALGPVARDASQSVPPDMNYRAGPAAQISRSVSRASRRPSFQVMAPLSEDASTPVARRTTPKPLSISPRSPPRSSAAAARLPQQPLQAPPRAQYPWSPAQRSTFERTLPPIPGSSLNGVAGANINNNTIKDAEGVAYAGSVKKRKTKMLRHEWHDQYATLKGTRLALHKDAQTRDRTLEYIDVDDYAIACSSLSSGSRLNAAFKAMSISRGAKDKQQSDDAIAAFSFQLIPQDAKGGVRLRKRESHSIGSGPLTGGLEGSFNGTGKTHHFAVKSRDERIDWMRELMLAKALKQKGEGFEVSVNGNMI
ncbi:hypothetical protein F5B20DRAFT_454341 [Whalleya microplaca]|nr:hypothetical protein F5B20DRAFT_454341 [Whalleya microplaca]